MRTEFNPLVSIIIPVYNGANFLAGAIDSAFAQTYQNTEIIVVNDGSDDNGATERIAMSYGDKIRYFHKPNGGVSSALNAGIEQMRGEYFSWLSHDDLYEPNKVAYEIDTIRNYERKEDTIVCCADNLIDANGKLIFHPAKRLEGKYSGSQLFDIFFSRHLNINGCSLLIHKSIFTRYGGFSSFRYIQDIECWIKFMLEGIDFVFVPEKLVKMRVHSGQVTQRMPELFYVEMNQFCNRIIDEYLNIGKLTESNIKAFLSYQYRNHNKSIYKRIENRVGDIMPIRKHCIMAYGEIFSVIKFFYSKILKR